MAFECTRGADCDTDHDLIVAKVRERLTVSKQAAQTFDEVRFHLRKLSVLEVRRRWEDNVKMDLHEVGCRDMDWIDLSQDRDR